MWKCDNCNTQNDNKVNSCIRCGVPRPKRIKGTPGSGGIFGTNAPSSSTGKSKSGFGGKKTRRTNLKSNRKTRNKRGVRRCNKTQRHRKTKKK